MDGPQEVRQRQVVALERGCTGITRADIDLELPQARVHAFEQLAHEQAERRYAQTSQGVEGCDGGNKAVVPLQKLFAPVDAEVLELSCLLQYADKKRRSEKIRVVSIDVVLVVRLPELEGNTDVQLPEMSGAAGDVAEDEFTEGDKLSIVADGDWESEKVSCTFRINVLACQYKGHDV